MVMPHISSSLQPFAPFSYKSKMLIGASLRQLKNIPELVCGPRRLGRPGRLGPIVVAGYGRPRAS